MNPSREKKEIEAQLERLKQLASEFPDGPTADHIRELQAELTEQLRRIGHD